MSKKNKKEELMNTNENKTVGQLKLALNALPDDAIIEDMFIDLDVDGKKGTIIPTKRVDEYCECGDNCTYGGNREVNPMNPDYDLYPGEHEDAVNFINDIAEQAADFVASIAFQCVCFNREHRVNHLTEMCRRYVEEE